MGLHRQADGGEFAEALALGNVAFGVGVEFTLSGFEVDAEGLQVLLDAGA